MQLLSSKIAQDSLQADEWDTKKQGHGNHGNYGGYGGYYGSGHHGNEERQQYGYNSYSPHVSNTGSLDKSTRNFRPRG